MHVLKGTLLKLASTIAFALVGALVRALEGRYPVGELVFSRAFFGLIPTLLVYAHRGSLRAAMHTDRVSDHFVRGGLNIIGVFCSFAALSRLPIADYTAIVFVAPLITVVIAAVVLKEQVHAYRWSAVVIGFCGIIVMLLPYLINHSELTATMILGVTFAFITALTSGGGAIQSKRMTATHTTSAIVIWMSFIVLGSSLLTLPFGWLMPMSWGDLVMLVSIGVLGGVGQMFVTDSYRYVHASFLAPLDYTSMLWAFMLGYWVFAEVPTAYTIGGALIIAGSGIFVILREQQLGVKRLRETPAEPIALGEEDASDAPAEPQPIRKAS